MFACPFRVWGGVVFDFDADFDFDFDEIFPAPGHPPAVNGLLIKTIRLERFSISIPIPPTSLNRKPEGNR